MHPLVTIFISFFAFSGLAQMGVWEPVKPRKSFKQKTKKWQISVPLEDNKSMIYRIQSNPAEIRIYMSHTKYHHSVSLSDFGFTGVTHVGLPGSLKEKGQVFYIGDQSQQLMVSVILGGRTIEKVILPKGLKAYQAFIADLHPVAEAERHL
ncbi:MAG: hypothetical protein ACK5PQ_04510 [Alphaproteobacteria bacterium]